MTQPIIWTGLDVHKDFVSVAVVSDADGEEEVRTVPYRLERLRRVFDRLGRRGEVRACYEASGCGYVLQRAMERWGHRCEVIAPSLIPKRAGDRRKTDQRDARKLATLYRAGELTPVRVPSQAEEQVRSLVRCREALRREVTSSRHYVTKFLLARGFLYRGGKHWTRRHWAWVRSLPLEGADAVTLRTYLGLLEVKLIERDTVDAEIARIAAEEPYRGPVSRLRCLRGIDTLTALGLAAEIGDPMRFASARRLMGYLGLTISEHSTGGVQRFGGITKTGNAHARRLLVEASWHYRHPPRRSKRLRECAAAQPPAVGAHAWRAQKRLHRRFQSLIGHVSVQKAIVAVARELTGFVWALLRTEPELLRAR